MNRIARFLLAAGTVACISLPCFAQTTSAPPTRFERDMSHVEFGLSGMGEFTKAVSGPVLPTNAPDYCVNPGPKPPQSGCGDNVVTESASNTLGGLGNIRFTPKPYLGVEFNYTYARYTESFNTEPYLIQTQVNETTFGYLVTPPHPIFGLAPFASAGFGSTRFRPTAGGGEGSPIQWRATYYYSVGVEREFDESHFGMRVGFRQAFFLAPDFLENYLTILKHTDTIEPNVGFYLRF